MKQQGIENTLASNITSFPDAERTIVQVVADQQSGFYDVIYKKYEKEVLGNNKNAKELYQINYIDLGMA